MASCLYFILKSEHVDSAITPLMSWQKSVQRERETVS